MNLPEVFRNRDFNLYWFGVVLSQIGTRGTVAANLYQIYQLTGSLLQTGLVGAAQAVALIVLSPLGGVYADRMDRRRLLQLTQAVSMVVAAGLAVLTFSGHAEAWHVLVSVLLTTAAATFDQPARQALIPALVPRNQLPRAFALLNPSREVAVLVGPSLAGVLIAIQGPGLMYAVDAVSYGVLVVVLAMLRTPHLQPGGSSPHASIRQQILEGVRFVAHRRLIWTLMSLDLAATVFGAYRVVLPALALDVLDVGPTGYGILSSAPSAGSLLATYVVFRIIDRSRRLGRVLLISTVMYGVSVVLLAQSPIFIAVVIAAGLIGACDAMATSIRHAAVQLETPDELRGRVSSIYQMASRGGPGLGDTLIGAVAGALGPVTALTIGGLITAGYAGSYLSRPNVVREYRGVDDPVEVADAPAAAEDTIAEP